MLIIRLIFFIFDLCNKFLKMVKIDFDMVLEVCGMGIILRFDFKDKFNYISG